MVITELCQDIQVH